jgi:hypothetical protein
VIIIVVIMAKFFQIKIVIKDVEMKLSKVDLDRSFEFNFCFVAIQIIHDTPRCEIRIYFC